MSYLAWLVPIALGMGLVGLMAFIWSMRSGQYEDLDGAAERVLLADAADAPLHQVEPSGDAERNGSSSRNKRRAGEVLTSRT
jgi:cbb3-type cytochrome oxidase maturation protein